MRLRRQPCKEFNAQQIIKQRNKTNFIMDGAELQKTNIQTNQEQLSKTTSAFQKNGKDSMHMVLSQGLSHVDNDILRPNANIDQKTFLASIESNDGCSTKATIANTGSTLRLCRRQHSDLNLNDEIPLQVGSNCPRQHSLGICVTENNASFESLIGQKSELSQLAAKLDEDCMDVMSSFLNL